MKIKLVYLLVRFLLVKASAVRIMLYIAPLVSIVSATIIN